MARAEEAAKLAPEDPEYVRPLESADYARPPAYFESTAAHGPSERADIVAAAIGEAVGRDTTIAGFLENYGVAYATGNSRGVFGYFPMTWIEYSNTVRTPDGAGSGWAGVRLHDAGGLDGAGMARIAAEKAVASRTVTPLEPGVYPVILEPVAAAVMAGALVGQMNARRAMEGRSYLSATEGATKLGEQLLSPLVTIHTDPLHREAPGPGVDRRAASCQGDDVVSPGARRVAAVRPLLGGTTRRRSGARIQQPRSWRGRTVRSRISSAEPSAACS